MIEKLKQKEMDDFRCLSGTLEEPIGVFNGACDSKAVKSKVDSESAKPKSVIEGDF